MYNLIAQRDAKVGQQLAGDSSQIARESKRDSSAMKALALLTMVFLPGTFCASLFAMPFFDFSEPSGALILKDHFWLYWAVSVPLTVAILAIYGVFLVLVDWKRDMEDRHPQRSQSQPEGNGIAGWAQRNLWRRSGHRREKSE